MAADYFEIGAFTFPALEDAAPASNTCLTQAEFGSPAGWLSTEQLDDQLLDAAIQATIDNANGMTAALDKVDAYLAKDGDDTGKLHRQSLLGLLRPSLAELLCEPSSLP